jgi:hypothetical protein
MPSPNVESLCEDRDGGEAVCTGAIIETFIPFAVFARPIPEGLMEIARRFNAGIPAGDA